MVSENSQEALGVRNVFSYVDISNIRGKICQVYPPKNFLSPISLKVREIIVLVNLF